VVADGQGNLWVLDPAAPGNEKVVAGGPKLVRIELATNKAAQVIRFGEDVALQGSYLNDVRFHPAARPPSSPIPAHAAPSSSSIWQAARHARRSTAIPAPRPTRRSRSRSTARSCSEPMAVLHGGR